MENEEIIESPVVEESNPGIDTEGVQETTSEPAESLEISDLVDREFNKQKTAEESKVKEEIKDKTEYIEPPISWAKEGKEHFKTLPREIQRIISKRESEREKFLSEKTQESSKYTSKYKELDEVVAPYQKKFQAVGFNFLVCE
jgi:hypothetical protein